MRMNIGEGRPNMANKPNQKEKLLHLAAALMELTDEERSVSTDDLIGYLAERGVDAERKSVYRDIRALAKFGLVAEQPVRGGWQLVERPFSAWDLQLLCDAVQASPVLSQRQADNLTGRLLKFASAGMRNELAHAVEVPAGSRVADGRVPVMMAAIRRAMARGRKVSIAERYLVKGPDGVHERVLDASLATPVRIVFAQGRYWLVAYFDREPACELPAPPEKAYPGGISRYRRGKPSIHFNVGDRGWFDQFRIDLLKDVHVAEEAATHNAQVAVWRLEDSDAPQFGVKGAAPEPVTLGVYAGGGTLERVLERFAGECDVFPQEGFGALGVRVYAKAPLTPEFFGWLSQFGGRVRIEGPKRARDAYCKHLAAAAEATAAM